MSLSPLEIDLEEYHLVHPELNSLVQRMARSMDKGTLETLKEEFNEHCNFANTQSDSEGLFQNLWDFFFDYCVFEKHLPESLNDLSDTERQKWEHVRDKNFRSLFLVKNVDENNLKLKELKGGKSYLVKRNESGNFLGISKGDFLECRLVTEGTEKKPIYRLARRPSFHPQEVGTYLKTKIKTFKKSKDEESYQEWLWHIVGMYLKHHIYEHMPIDKIYNDNSRI